MGNKNKDKKKQYRQQYLESLGERDFPELVQLDMGPKVNHFLSRVYYGEHHSKVRLLVPDKYIHDYYLANKKQNKLDLTE